MTRRLCLLGDSHLAALRVALNDAPDLAGGWAIDMFGSPRGGMGDVAVENGCLVPQSDQTAADFRQLGAADRIDLAAYDAFAVVGLGLSVMQAVRLWRGMRVYGMPSVTAGGDTDVTLVSRPLFTQVLSEHLAATLSYQLVKLLTGAVTVPILILPQPYPAPGILRDPRKGSGLRQICDSGDAAEVAAQFTAGARHAFGSGFLPQPVRTIRSDVLTAVRFTQGSVRLRADLAHPSLHPGADMVHANAAYGVVCLKQIRGALHAGESPA